MRLAPAEAIAAISARALRARAGAPASPNHDACAPHLESDHRNNRAFDPDRDFCYTNVCLDDCSPAPKPELDET